MRRALFNGPSLISANSDCTYKNIMLDASAMYPYGFHPVRSSTLPDGRTLAWPRRRTSVPVRYYFIDYGLSTYFPPGTHPRLVVGEDGRDQEVPELSDDIPYDPFKVDIFIIGNLFRRMFYDVSPLSFVLQYRNDSLAEIFQCRLPSTSV